MTLFLPWFWVRCYRCGSRFCRREETIAPDARICWECQRIPVFVGETSDEP